MSDLTFARLHEHLVHALPELARPVALLCEDEVFSTNGVPSQYSGTSHVLQVYLDLLLALPSSPLRDSALSRAFAFVEAALASGDEDLVGLMDIQLIEGQAAWWFQRAKPFLGPRFEAAVRRSAEPGWVEATAPNAPDFPPRVRLHDLYDVRSAVAALLAEDGVDLVTLESLEADE
ncbi:hypothetical protein [Deinococcus pimensis]|uniref:hypothetical protein n=1 Tax=Deinococcus pimensis TaxID=309888 RepID=UPI0004890A45|nr:hypothetical protein [Deinococcus pimensis]